MALSEVTFKQLEAFVFTAQLGTVTAAADLLQRAQPTVSKELKVFERRLGDPLFDRVKAKMVLTPLGARLLKPAQDLLAAREAFVATAGAPGAKQSIVVACSPSIANKLMPAVLQHLEKDGSPVRIADVLEADTGSVEKLVAQRKADVGICHLAQEVEGTRVVTLGHDQLAFLAAPEVVEALRSGDIETVSHVPLLTWPRDNHPEYFDLIVDCCRGIGFEPLALIGAQRLGGPRRYLLEQGRAFGIVPEDAAEVLNPRLDFEPLGPLARVPVSGVVSATQPVAGDAVFATIRDILAPRSRG